MEGILNGGGYKGRERERVPMFKGTVAESPRCYLCCELDKNWSFFLPAIGLRYEYTQNMVFFHNIDPWKYC